jgi:glycosyltransferase involved in cell wall biosynthesis
MEAQPTVVLLTGSYPYDLMGEGSFLGPELPYLVREFARVLVVPAARGGGRADLPDGIEVDESLAIALATRVGPLKTFRHAMICPPARGEIGRRLDVLRSVTAVRRLIASAATATCVARWYADFSESHRLDSRSTVLYSYWLDALPIGLALARIRQPLLVVVSRGHRVDVYEEEQSPPYLPCRKWLLKHLDRVFLVSENARSYLLSRYPEAVDRLMVSRLGSPEPGFLASPSADGILRVVSCSAFLPVKQVDVLARGLMLAAGNRRDRPIEWHHFGGGPLRREIETLLSESTPSNLSWAFRGHVSNAELFHRYRSHPTDLFANTSRSEGIPVSIMEAQSCGIPVMAPAVGGVPEAVSPENGFLLPAPATPAAVAEVVGSVLCTPGLLGPLRDRSRRSWEGRFRAAHNFGTFARELSALRLQLGGTTA